ncbi:MAG TPA: response regulator [Longimicrobiales bacterium]|nr:response regulator [Longimicrobiales bacterium]
MGRRILVAEDEPHIRRILLALLESAEFDVDVAVDGRQALERIASPEMYDLILTDLMMPHHTGLDLLKEIQGMVHRRTTPVIMLTAKGQDADRQLAAALGARDFITKPFSPKKLLARIHELLDD